MQTISLKLPEGLHAQLNRVAKQRGLSKSELVRDALEHFLNGTRKAARFRFWKRLVTLSAVWKGRAICQRIQSTCRGTASEQPGVA